MEIPAIQGLQEETALLVKEQPARAHSPRRKLAIGVPGEHENDERRIALAPQAVALLVANGHEVRVETKAGSAAQFSDEEYAEAGAEVIEGPSGVYVGSDVIAKVFPPRDEELAMMQEGQVLLSALHLGGITPAYLNRLIELRATAIGFEFITDVDGTLPIVRMMHEISGSVAVQTAAHLLESATGGRGVMLGGISGIPPSTVVILGAGVVGEWAARTALGFGAHVVVLDSDLPALRSLEHYLGRRITTAVATPHYIRKAVKSADVVIGAMLAKGKRSPMLVTEDMVSSMRSGSVIVDVVIDQGGCVETSRPTTPSDPTYDRYGVIHYCVPNIPSTVARTATYALSNVLTPYVLDIGDAASINDALWKNACLRSGTYVYRRHLTKESLASMFGMAFRDIELLIAGNVP